MGYDPQRLLDDAKVDADLKKDLKTVRDADGGYDEAAGLSRLQRALERQDEAEAEPQPGAQP